MKEQTKDLITLLCVVVVLIAIVLLGIIVFNFKQPTYYGLGIIMFVSLGIGNYMVRK